MIKRVSVKTPHYAVLNSLDGGCAGCVVEQWKLAKSFAWNVCLKRRWSCLALENFCAQKTSRLQHIHAVTRLAFCYDLGAFWGFDLVYCINNDLHLVFIQSVKHKCLQQPFSKTNFGLVALSYNLGLKIAFFVKSPVNFSWNALPWSSFLFDWFFLFTWFTSIRITIRGMFCIIIFF